MTFGLVPWEAEALSLICIDTTCVRIFCHLHGPSRPWDKSVCMCACVFLEGGRQGEEGDGLSTRKAIPPGPGAWQRASVDVYVGVA